jgi:hypothetical protein
MDIYEFRESLMKKLKQVPIATVTILTAGLFVVGVGAPAHAIPNPAQQGGADGVLFFTDINDGAIYLGNIRQTQLHKSVFWQESGIKVNSVAVTETRIAWSLYTAVSGDPRNSADLPTSSLQPDRFFFFEKVCNS